MKGVNHMKLFYERRKYAILTLCVFCANYFFDRLTKFIAFNYLKGKGPLGFLGNTIILIYVENTGAFFNLGSNWNLYIKYFTFIIAPLIACMTGLIYLIFREKKIFRIITGSCIIGGGAGNLFDRFFNEFKVIDFINFGIENKRTGVLNTADISVTFGVIFLFIYEMNKRPKMPHCSA